MSDLKICRICLKSNLKLFKYDRYQLGTYYQQIMAIKVYETDNLPSYFCYECAAMMYKFHKFKEKCCTGQETLRNLMIKGSLTLKSVQRIVCENRNQHFLDITIVNNRVRTYKVRSHNDISDSSDHDNVDDAMDHNNTDNKSDIYVDEPMMDQIEEDNPDIENTLKIENEFADTFSEQLSDNEKLDDTKIIEEDDKIVPKIIEREDKSVPTIIEGEYMSVPKIIEGEYMSVPKIIEGKDMTIPTIIEDEDKTVLKPTVDRKEQQKPKKFEVSKIKTPVLDPNNWLKMTLTEEEALKEFKARGDHSRYISAEYKCMDCLKGFSKEEILKRHFKLGHNVSIGPFECRFCHMRFKWKCFLTRHMKQHYTKFKCLRCDLVCPLEKTAMFHEEYHNGVTRKCAHCGEEFKHLNTYYTHLRTHPSEHVCTLCGASFFSNKGLILHKKFKHPGEVSEVPQGEGEYCDRCDIRFETRNAYEEHLLHSAKHVDKVEDGQSKVARKSKPRKRRLEVRRTIPTDCHICGKHFDTQSAFKKHHLAEHPGTSIFSDKDRQICDICGTSVIPGTMASHHLTHSKEKSVQCTLCDTKFKQIRSMKFHYRTFHEKIGTEKFTCATCGMQLTTKKSLERHLMTHTGEKPFECSLCDKRFTRKNSMQLHYRTFHLNEPYPKRNRKRKEEKKQEKSLQHSKSKETKMSLKKA